MRRIRRACALAFVSVFAIGTGEAAAANPAWFSGKECTGVARMLVPQSGYVQGAELANCTRFVMGPPWMWIVVSRRLRGQSQFYEQFKTADRMPWNGNGYAFGRYTPALPSGPRGTQWQTCVLMVAVEPGTYYSVGLTGGCATFTV